MSQKIFWGQKLVPLSLATNNKQDGFGVLDNIHKQIILRAWTLWNQDGLGVLDNIHKQIILGAWTLWNHRNRCVF